ncbi:MAG: hypothetical protein HYZ53_04315 [Planctomycetes bacterium]|nr:hypothetical protein [Planctomycetota bacterium]
MARELLHAGQHERLEHVMHKLAEAEVHVAAARILERAGLYREAVEELHAILAPSPGPQGPEQQLQALRQRQSDIERQLGALSAERQQLERATGELRGAMERRGAGGERAGERAGERGREHPDRRPEAQPDARGEKRKEGRPEEPGPHLPPGAVDYYHLPPQAAKEHLEHDRAQVDQSLRGLKEQIAELEKALGRADLPREKRSAVASALEHARVQFKELGARAEMIRHRLLEVTGKEPPPLPERPEGAPFPQRIERRAKEIKEGLAELERAQKELEAQAKKDGKGGDLRRRWNEIEEKKVQLRGELEKLAHVLEEGPRRAKVEARIREVKETLDEIERAIHALQERGSKGGLDMEATRQRGRLDEKRDVLRRELEDLGRALEGKGEDSREGDRPPARLKKQRFL